MKKAIIIGATSGIGKELALLSVRNNYKTGITGRRVKLLNKIKKLNPELIITKNFDASDINETNQKIDELIEELGGLDLLILSSGTGHINDDLDFETEKKTIDLNVTGFTNIVGRIYNFFEKQGYGHLVAISSVAGLRGSRQTASYNASKSYQINYLEGLRQKTAKSKSPVFVTDIRPGLTDTDMAKGEGLFWVMPADKVARQIFAAIKKKKKVVYVTKRWRFIAVMLKMIPQFLYNKM